MNDRPERPGYHLATIPRGELGESSKILEEVLELQDAESQGCRIMGLCELADIYGALQAYLEKHHPVDGSNGIDMDDLERMAFLTRRAFESGRRK